MADPGERAGSQSADTATRGRPWKAIVLVIVAVYAILLVIANSKSVKVSFVLFSTRTSVLFLILLSMALGALITLLVQRMLRRRRDAA